MADIAKRGFLDFLISFIFIFVGSTGATAMLLIHPFFGDDDTTKVVTLLAIIALQLVMFGGLSDALGGAAFNTTDPLGRYILRIGDISITELGVRIPAQVIGGVLGAYAIQAVLPPEYHHTLTGPQLGSGIDIWTAVIAESLLSFAANLVVFYALFAGPKLFIAKVAIIIVGILGLIIVGQPYTGPSMNPVLAFSWAYVHRRHNTYEHLYVYWLAPIIGTILAATVFGSLVTLPEKKPPTIQAESMTPETDEEPSKDGKVKAS